MIHSLVFDCDGVLIDSVPVKTRAFAKLAEPYGHEARDRFVRYHMEHGGVNRTQKFAWFFEHVLGRPITPEESHDFGQRFARICQEELAACPLVAGTLEVLSRWQPYLPLYVCSGAPTEEQRAVLRAHGLEGYFTGIFGAPPAKAELLKHIVELSGVAPQETLMVGDATTDRDAAVQVGCLFYGVGPQLEGGDHPWGADLTELTAYIEANR